jgi:E3 ubiquitin ligase
MEFDLGTFVFVIEPFNRLGLLGLVALLGIYCGVYVFFRGFRMLQHKRLILNTPLSKIRSASMGLVEVSGMAAGPQTIPAGITGEPCYYYHASAWQQAESDRQRGWEKVVDESVGVPFFVDDGTGRMLVYPQGAKLDVHRNFREEYGGSFFTTREMVPESVRNFLLRHGIAPSGMIRLEERCILPGYPLFVFGTLGENSGSGPWTPEPHVHGSRSSGSAGSNSLQSLGKSTFEALSRVAGVRVETSRVTVSRQASSRSSPDLRIQHQAAPWPSAMPEQIRTAAGGVKVSNAHPSAYALTAVSDHGGAASSGGTTNRPGSSPGDSNAQGGKAPEFDLHPHAAIARGERHELFTISSQSQREVVQSLQWKAAVCIWGGPVIALSCLYFLIVSLTWS